MMAHYYHKPPDCEEGCPFCPSQATYNLVTLLAFVIFILLILFFASLFMTKEQRNNNQTQFRHNESEEVVKILPTDPPQVMMKSNGQVYITKFHGNFENYDY
jgi:hypothetical protein